MKLKELFQYFISLPKTILFNFKYFPFKVAVKLPVFISYNTLLSELSGNIQLGIVHMGCIKIGFGSVGIFDKSRSRTIWQVSGKVIFEGIANIGHGSKLSVKGKLLIGDNFIITAESSIVSHNEIVFGSNCLLSWDILIMDTDFHIIRNSDNVVTNSSLPIVIGSNVWIGCRSTILKGVKIPYGCIIGASSNVVNSIYNPHSIIAGNPAKIIKENILWDY